MATAYVAAMCVAMCVGAGMMSGVTNVLIHGVARVRPRCAARPVLDAMTLHNDFLGQMRYEWRHVGRTTQSRRSLAALDERFPDLRLGGLTDLFDIVILLEARGGRTRPRTRSRSCARCSKQADDPQVHRALLQTLLPGIVSVCRQLRFGDGIVDEPSETLAMAVGLASELLSDWAGQSRQYAAPDILSALRGRLRRWLLKEKAARRAVANFEQRDEPAAESSPSSRVSTAFAAVSTRGLRVSPTRASTRVVHSARLPPTITPRLRRSKKSYSTSLCAS